MSIYDDRSLETTEAMLERYAETGDRTLRDRIVESNLRIAAMIARRYSGKGIDYDDLYQVASLALVKAVDRFDPARGIKFVSFVTPTVIGTVKNYFRDRYAAVKLPRNSSEMFRAIDKATDELAQTLMRMPTPEEIAEHIGVDIESVLLSLDMRGAVRPVEMDRIAETDEEGMSIAESLGVEERAFADFETGEILKKAMESLDARQKEVIRLRFFEGMNQRDAANVIGISQMSVSRTERRALEIMRAALADTED